MRSCVCEQSTTCAATPLTSRAFSPATSSIGTTPPSSLPAMQLPLRRSRRYIVHTEAAVSSMSRHAHTPCGDSQMQVQHGITGAAEHRQRCQEADQYVSS